MRQGPWGYNGKEEQQDSSDAQSHTSREAESCLSERERERMPGSQQQRHSLTVNVLMIKLLYYIDVFSV